MRRGLIADSELETGRAPVDELNSALRLDDRHRSVDILGDDVATVQQRTRHCDSISSGNLTKTVHSVLTVLALPRVALDHLVAGLETRERHISDRVLLMVCLLSRDDRGESGEGEVDTGEGDQVGLELVQVDVEGAVETERGGD